MPLSLMLVAGLLLGIAVWFFHRRRSRVPCRIDYERTHDHLHAHVELERVLLEAGDAFRIEDAPTSIEYGERRTVESAAVVERASWPRRQWTRIAGRFNIHELYDVGFE